MADEPRNATDAENGAHPRTTAVKLSSYTTRSLRILAAEEDCSVAKLIRDALGFWWDEKHKSKRGELFLPEK